MKTSFLMRFFWLSIFSVLLFSVVTAVAATNTIPNTRLGYKNLALFHNNLKPSACASISVTTLVTGAGVITGTMGNDLILASPGVDIIDGSGGNDCIVGGSSDDILTGGLGNDICLGGPGTDSFISCEGQDQ
ncbi:MAG TPA: hypothetical protein VFQ23_05660 [Anaerolineales bacterium]|nr:hypothetical protein [Anaerolineales bacterium]